MSLEKKNCLWDNDGASRSSSCRRRVDINGRIDERTDEFFDLIYLVASCWTIFIKEKVENPRPSASFLTRCVSIRGRPMDRGGGRVRATQSRHNSTRSDSNGWFTAASSSIFITAHASFLLFFSIHFSCSINHSTRLSLRLMRHLICHFFSLPLSIDGYRTTSERKEKKRWLCLVVDDQ